MNIEYTNSGIDNNHLAQMINDFMVQGKFNDVDDIVFNIIKPIFDKDKYKDFIFHIILSDGMIAILIMKKDGKAFISCYWYEDNDESVDKSFIYLDWLSVFSSIRNNDISKLLLDLGEEIGIILNKKYSAIMCDKNKQMYDWYQRIGYQYYKDDLDVNDYVWLKKQLV